MSRPTDDAESEILAGPGGSGGRLDIDEREHQALDLLDEHPADLAQDAVSDEFAAAVAIVRALLPRLGATLGLTLADAASQLARTDERGLLELAALDETRITLLEHPRLGLAIPPAVEALATLLALDRSATAWAVLLELAEQADADADERLRACSTAIVERLAAAQPAAEVPVARALRVFRSAAVAHAGPSLRAQQLAADHPEHLGLALALVEHHTDAATLVDAFDQARAALELASIEPQSQASARHPPPPIDGPKRKFTYVHVMLASIVLGLTLWHYVFR